MSNNDMDLLLKAMEEGLENEKEKKLHQDKGLNNKNIEINANKSNNSIEQLEKEITNMKIDKISNINLGKDNKGNSINNDYQTKKPKGKNGGKLKGTTIMKDFGVLDDKNTIINDINWVKDHIGETFNIEQYYSKLIINGRLLQKQMDSYALSEDKGLFNLASKENSKNNSLLKLAKTTKEQISLIKKSVGLTTGNISNNLFSYLLWYIKSDSNEFNPNEFLVNSFNEADNELKQLLLDLAIGILIAFKEVDLISLTIGKLHVKNKLYDVFYSNKFNDARIKYEGLKKDILLKRISNEFGIDMESKKLWLQELLILLNVVFEVDNNNTLTNEELAKIIYNSNDVLPAKYLYNEPYSLEFLIALFNIQGLRSEFSINYNDVRNIIDNITSLMGTVDFLASNKAATTTLTKAMNELNKSITNLTDVVKKEEDKNNIIIINDFLNNPSEKERRNKLGAMSKEFFINENKLYEEQIKNNGSLNFIVTNNKKNKFYVKQNRRLVAMDLSSLLFNENDLGMLRMDLNDSDMKGVTINEFFFKWKNKET